jgi:hypothetical protein
METLAYVAVVAFAFAATAQAHSRRFALAEMGGLGMPGGGA